MNYITLLSLQKYDIGGAITIKITCHNESSVIYLMFVFIVEMVAVVVPVDSYGACSINVFRIVVAVF